MTTQQAAFIEKMAPIAQRQSKKHDGKIFPSVCIAMAIHESGWGTAQKMAAANALFGFKVGSGKKYGSAWKGKAYKSGTTEYYDGKTATRITDFFRAYDSVEDSTEDYMDLLCTAARYKKALSQPTPQKCIEGIVGGGYASGPDYQSAILNLISTYNLTKYDGDPGYQEITPDLITMVIEGAFGNGKAREAALTKAGYNYSEVRAKINELDKIGKEHLREIKNKTGDYADCVLQLMCL